MADLAKVQPAYEGLPRFAAGLLPRELGSRLHSGYLYGSIVRGNAVPGRSDADLVAVLWASATDEDRQRARRVETALRAVPGAGRRRGGVDGSGGAALSRGAVRRADVPA